MTANLLYRTERYRHIISVLVRWGVVELTGHILKLPSLKRVPEAERLTRGARFRRALEELGGTFIKIGQILSVRPDIVPLDVCSELSKLQDQVPPDPFEKIAPILTQEFGASFDEVFLEFETEPVAAASLAQVYRAKTKSGETVAVKVLRPNIRQQINFDISLMRQIAEAGELISPIVSEMNPMLFVDEFARSLRRETDLIWERRNIDRFKSLCANDDTVYIPNTYPDLSTKNILVMEFIDGIKVSDMQKLKDNGISLETVAERGATLIVHSIFDYGFFHADPHPGNILVLPDNVVAPLDYGMVGYVEEITRISLFDMVRGVVKTDVDLFMRGLEAISVLPVGTSEREIRRDITEMIHKYAGVSLRDLNLSEIGEDSFSLFRRFKLRIPSDWSMLVKALITVEGLGRTIAPGFNAVEFLQPYVKQYIYKRWSPSKIFISAGALLEDALRTSMKLPDRLNKITEKLQRGELTVNLEHRRLEKLTREINRSSNRLSVAVIIAALLISSGLVMSLGKGPQFLGLPAISFFNYGIGVILGLYLVFDMLRKRKI
jgi:ubiquinone biosynthesis protein